MIFVLILFAISAQVHAGSFHLRSRHLSPGWQHSSVVPNRWGIARAWLPSVNAQNWRPWTRLYWRPYDKLLYACTGDVQYPNCLVGWQWIFSTTHITQIPDLRTHFVFKYFAQCHWSCHTIWNNTLVCTYTGQLAVKLVWLLVCRATDIEGVRRACARRVSLSRDDHQLLMRAAASTARKPSASYLRPEERLFLSLQMTYTPHFVQLVSIGSILRQLVSRHLSSIKSILMATNSLWLDNGTEFLFCSVFARGTDTEILRLKDVYTSWTTWRAMPMLTIYIMELTDNDAITK